MAIRAARRYAKALADVVGETADTRRVLGELGDFHTLLQANRELLEVFEAPAVPLAAKLRVLDAILKRLGASLPASNFLRVLVRNHRMAYFDDIYRAFRRLANERLGIVAVKVYSAEDLAAPEREALAARFRVVTGKQVEFEFHLDPDLVAGLRAQVGSTVYDGSVRGALDRLKEQLTAA
ncbi:MAG TPA: ATP synthase F1 subunit delta [Terriglobia bacterium]|nr:ATP synthase F1 subunit delta [Terriglobia bacterium]